MITKRQSFSFLYTTIWT